MKYAFLQGSYSTDGEAHIGYGIRYIPDSSLSFEDLSVDPTIVANLVKLCNESNLSPIHLADVVEDFLV